MAMTIVDEKNWSCFLYCIGGLLATDEVQSMKKIRHHPGTSCYEHSVFVSYTAFRLARRWGLDYRAAARAGLLHDLYLYDPHDRSAYQGNQCFAHPKAALRNADALVGGLTEKEKNIIISHMWPLARYMPRYREAYVVNLADKLCATAEVLGYWRRSPVKRIAMAA
ncbi:HD domain protein [uncultured Eubacteriales bacterium]|uniref:HD domain protein n=1 Tax=uncultured Eubacteriales bacterium TaxID=172733 RepID=A0A212KLV8_9FIRM|nr:HD domain protein [uncultured Eubacteriales bacterium]